MSRRPSVRVAAAALGVALVLGFGAAALAAQDDGGGSSTPSADFGPDGPGPADRPDPALSGSPVPTLPPGDPGTESPEEVVTDEPSDDTSEEERDESAVTEIPGSALVDPETVGALAGGSWSVDPADADACLTEAPAGSTASRAGLLTSNEGHLVQSVSAHPGLRAAKASVEVTADRLAACGFTPAGDPRLGEASSRLTRTTAAGDQEVAVVISAEGVSVLLVAAGSAAADGVWESLADVAMGTSCAAATHPCH